MIFGAASKEDFPCAITRDRRTEKAENQKCKEHAILLNKNEKRTTKLRDWRMRTMKAILLFLKNKKNLKNSFERIGTSFFFRIL